MTSGHAWQMPIDVAVQSSSSSAAIIGKATKSGSLPDRIARLIAIRCGLPM
jgi:hypothetical protein